MQATAKKGVYKRPEPEEIAYLVKMMRKHLGWKQLVLAHEAGVTERTIGRLESAERTSDDILRKVAKALKFAEGIFTDPSYCPSDEELEAMKKEVDKYTHTPLHALSGLSDLENIFGAHAYLVDGHAVDDALAEDIAAIKDYVQDCGDIYGEVPHSNQLTYSRELLEMIRAVEAQGYIARWSRYVTDDKFKVGVLVFLKTADSDASEHFRHAAVPRSLMQSLRS